MLIGVLFMDDLCWCWWLVLIYNEVVFDVYL